jgi:V-type H+-transporting ATPase subunit a
MLLPKPLILKKRWEASQKAKSTHGSSVELTLVDDHVDEDMSRRPSGGHGSNINLSAKAEEHGGGGHGHGHGDHFDFGEVGSAVDAIASCPMSLCDLYSRAVAYHGAP